jgi:malonyl-CoA O-methyltransferase
MNATDHSKDLRPADVRRRFDRAANRFDEADFVHRVTRDGLLQRMHPMSAQAANVIDLGSATGAAIPLLQRRFRHARVIAVDFSAGMLRGVRSKKTLLSKRHAVQADARMLPFADASIDVVFSNLMLPWIDNLGEVFAEVARVLQSEGLFVFSTLGPDSLLELREAWRTVDDGMHVNRFPDMHDVGDALVRAGLRDPVLDVDRLAVSYRSAAALLRDLTAAGARNSLRDRQRGLMSRKRFRRFTDAVFPGGGERALTLELVYGHCWGGGAGAGGGDVMIDARKIPLRRQ